MFRIERFNNKSINEIQLQFNEDIDPNVTIANVNVGSNISNIPALEVLAVKVLQSVITITVGRQRPQALYFVEFLNVAGQQFASVDNNTLQNNNKFFFLGQERENEIRDEILEKTPGVFDTDQETFVRQHLSNVSDQMLRGRTDIRETGNGNFLYEQVDDESKTRGFGPTDRVNEEGAFEILRVATTPEGSTERKIFNIDSSKPSSFVASADTDFVNLSASTFTSDPFSLKSIEVNKEIISNTETILNSFDGTTFNLSKDNIAVVYAITLKKSGGTDIVYDLPTYGYSLQSNRHDTIFGRTLPSLSSNQVKVADLSVIEGDFESPVGADEIEISYLYIDTGMNIIDDVELSQLKTVTRELISPLLTIFSLKHFPVVLASDTVPTLGGVTFLDPSTVSGTPFTSIHPAFSTELPYDETSLPSNPGEYSVNYAVGEVFVYGETISDGTGQIPPVADYFYRKVYSDGIDYNFDTDSDEVVAVPSRDIIGSEVKINFAFERIFAEGVDYTVETHVEVINEFVENRLESQTKLLTKHYPITDVFQVRNSTTGEDYSISRFDDNYIHFSGFNLPRFNTKENEQVAFSLASNETLFVTEEISVSPSLKILKVQLDNNELTSFSGQKRGTNINSSLSLSRKDLFLREFFFDNVLQDLSTNLAKLLIMGDYLVDYETGALYLLADIDQSLDIGSGTYYHGKLTTVFSQVVGVNTIEYRKGVKGSRVLEVQPDSYTSTEIDLAALPDSVERFYSGNSNKPITMGSIQFGSAGQRFPESFEFVALDGEFTDSMADGYHILRIPGDVDRGITSVSSTNTLLVDIKFDDFDRSSDWCIIDYNFSDGYELAVTYDIANVQGVYTVTDLQTNDKDSLTNLYDPALDTISGNKITFNNDAMKAIAAGSNLAIDYSFGTLWLDYNYIQDILEVSYEHGDNSIAFSNTTSLSPGDDYFVSYRYGALRDNLLSNFGSLTQILELTTFPLDFDRELYRDFLRGTLQGFVNGPTNQSIKTLVSSVTGIEPEITELTFNEWTVGRDNLHLSSGTFSGTERYDSGRFDEGLVVEGTNTLSFPSEAYLSHREGTFQSWATPGWDGIDNDSDITIDIDADVADVFIGASAYNPTEIPFTLNKLDDEPQTSVGRPANWHSVPGHYIWFDDLSNKWNFSSNTDATGEITTSGQIHNVEDGYNLTSTTSYIRFDGYGDGLDGYYTADDGYALLEGFTWSSDDSHYLWDTGPSLYHNRLSIFKDGAGYLNFRVFDDSGKRYPSRSRQYNLSYNIQDWVAREPHFISASWRLNSVEGIDEMHLFVDGQEVSNVFKYGGKPIADVTDIYRTVADEILTASSTKDIVGGLDGSSNATATFTSAGSDFVNDGIVPGDTLSILDATADGIPGTKSIIGVGPTSLVLSAPLLLTLDDINFSVNRTSFTTQTNVDVEKFAVFVEDGYSVRTELRGVEADEPDYTVERDAGVNTININKGVAAGEAIIINTLGLTNGRCRDSVFEYEDGYSIQTRGAPPATLDHLEAYKVFCPRVSIDTDGYKFGDDGYFITTGTQIDGYFSSICEPSNVVRGKTVSAILGGIDNIDFSGLNQIIINGTTFSGATTETLNFSDYGTQTTTEFFTNITTIYMTFTSFDPTISFGSIEILEAQPFTQSEGGGDYAQPASWDNGVFSFIVFGSGGLSFDIEGGCYYKIDYPIRLNIPMSEKGKLWIGSSISGTDQWDGTIDQTILLNEMLDDVRAGEDKGEPRTITEDFNSPVPLTSTPQTLMLLNLDKNIENVPVFYKPFDERFLTSSSSVNSSFGDAVVFMNKESFVIDNNSTVFNNQEGSVEFWVNPLIDTLYDNDKDRYYVDATSIQIEKVTSDTAKTIILPVRAKRIVSIRLLTDDGTGVDYFEGGNLFIDGKTVVLGDRLPSANTVLEVQFVPVNFNGDRFSIYKSTDRFINFSIVANEQEFVIRYPIDWKRGSWHRILATWSTNSADGADSMRLFVDGIESGTILWGTPGLIWGGGSVYGSALVGSAGSNALIANIDLLDTFGDIHIGNSFDGRNTGTVKMDNIRWSSVAREPSVVAGKAVDLNWGSNVAAVLPVVEDNYTKLLLDFTRSTESTEFLSNVFSKNTPLFQIDVTIDDSFGKMNDQRSRDIMEEVLNRMKPAHTKLLVKYLQEL